MKRHLILLVTFLAMVCSAGATTLTGTIKKGDGTGLTGRIRLKLSHPARSITDSSVVVPIPVDIAVVAGAMLAPPPVYGNDDLQPSNTYYVAEYYNEFNAKVMQNAFYITGATFDLGAAIPTSITTTNISYASPDIGLRTDLASAVVGKGDALIAYKASGTGAVSRTVNAWLADQSVNVKDYGADPAGVLNSTTAFNNAIASIASGGIVWVPPGTYSVDPLTMASNITLIGAGRQATILTTTTTGTLFNLTQLTGVHLQGFKINKTGTAGGTALKLAAVQYSSFSDLVINGVFSTGILLTTVDDASFGSTIYNHFQNILVTGLNTNGVGLKLTELSGSVQNKVVNGNTFSHVIIGPNTNDGITAVQFLNANTRTSLNENTFIGGDWSSNGTKTGTGLSTDNSAFRGLTMIGVTIESNKTAGVVIGSSGADTSEGFLMLNCELASNGGNTAAENFTDNSPSYRHLIRSNISSLVGYLRLTPAGGFGIDSIGLGGAAPRGTSNDLNFGGAGTISVSGSTIAQIGVSASKGLSMYGTAGIDAGVGLSIKGASVIDSEINGPDPWYLAFSGTIAARIGTGGLKAYGLTENLKQITVTDTPYTGLANDSYIEVNVSVEISW